MFVHALTSKAELIFGGCRHVQLTDEVVVLEVVVLCVEDVADSVLEVLVVLVDVVEVEVADVVLEVSVTVVCVIVVPVSVEDVAVLVGHWQLRGRPTQPPSQSPSQQ